jgi:6,7-dimethyl-8-ribityllumazine synthase
MIEYQGGLEGEGRRIGIVVSRFNEIVTRELLAGAHDCLIRQGVQDEAITVAWVPGAWEIPSALASLNRSGEFDALIALGAVIRGATPHFDYIASGVANGVASLAATLDIPVIFGVLTTNDLEQALERAGAESANKGWDSALAALEMANLFDQLSG